MPILAIGSKRINTACTPAPLFSGRTPAAVDAVNHSDAGFTLIELLVAIAIMAVVLGLAVLAIPNHDERYWKDNLDQLVSSLNLAQEESAMSGTPMMAQIDSGGWRFFVPNANGAYGSNASGGQALGLSGNSSGLMPDVYRPQTWYKPLEIAPLQLTLGGEQVAQVLQIPIKQGTGSGAQLNTSDTRQAILIRNRNGRFSWIKQ